MQSVSEELTPDYDFFILFIDVTAARKANRDYEMVFVHDSNSTATVEPISPQNINFDVKFGHHDRPSDPLQERHILKKGMDSIDPPLRVEIRDDVIPEEEEECFTIRIEFNGSIFMCNDDDTGAMNFFCKHTICIEDDDG